jgi:FkbH-like protein
MHKHWPDELIIKSEKAFSSRSIIEIRDTLNEFKKLEKKFDITNLRISIVRTFTIESQIDFIKLALFQLPSKPIIKISNLENIEQEILNIHSDLHKSNPNLILLLWRLEELAPNIFYEYAKSNLKKIQYLKKNVKTRIKELINNYSSVSDTPLFISTLPDLQNTKSFDKIQDHNLSVVINDINSFIYKLIKNKNNIYPFEFNLWSSINGAESFDRKMDYYARQPISINSIGSFSKFIAKSVKPIIYPPSKVILFDADNVLWGGVVGEEGVDKISIDDNYPGNIYKKIQEFALKLKSRGVIIGMISKNNLNDIKNVFRKKKLMPLKFKDFDIVKANWKEKFINANEIAKELNLSTNSFLFVDDQPFEQEQMKYNIPDIKILKNTKDPLNILENLENCDFFDQYNFSNEDSLRSKDYKAEIKRKSLKKTINNVEDFLNTLGLQSNVEEINQNNIIRVEQMLKKTNQFNLTTKRHDTNYLNRIINDKKNIHFTVSLSDKFGSQGIIGLIIGINERDKIIIDSFLLSCRALGRGVEDLIWHLFLKKCKERKIKEICAQYIKSDKNTQVSNLYDKFKMRATRKHKQITDYKLTNYSDHKKPRWIKISQ